MPKFKITRIVLGALSVTIDADSLEQADEQSSDAIFDALKAAGIDYNFEHSEHESTDPVLESNSARQLEGRLSMVNNAMSKPEIQAMLVLSTAHVQESTADLFEMQTDDLPIFYAKEEYGWFIPLIDGFDFPHTCPAELVKIREYAELHGCSWIMLDRDADTIDELPTWEW